MSSKYGKTLAQRLGEAFKQPIQNNSDLLFNKKQRACTKKKKQSESQKSQSATRLKQGGSSQ